MEDTLKIRGIDGIDGDYKFDLIKLLALTGPSPEALTNGELHRIKTMTGIRAGEIGSAFQADDSDLMIGIAAVVLERNKVRFDDQMLWDAQFLAIEIEMGKRTRDGDGDVGPPESPLASDETDSPARTEQPPETKTSSGVDSEVV
jgi:hypothetical protein